MICYEDSFLYNEDSFLYYENSFLLAMMRGISNPLFLLLFTLNLQVIFNLKAMLLFNAEI